MTEVFLDLMVDEQVLSLASNLACDGATLHVGEQLRVSSSKFSHRASKFRRRGSNSTRHRAISAAMEQVRMRWSKSARHRAISVAMEQIHTSSSNFGGDGATLYVMGYCQEVCVNYILGDGIPLSYRLL